MVVAAAFGCAEPANPDVEPLELRLGDDQTVLDNKLAVIDYLGSLSERSTNRVVAGQLQTKSNGPTRAITHPYDDPRGFMRQVYDHTGAYPGLMGVRYDKQGNLDATDIQTANTSITDWWSNAGGLVMVGAGFANPEGTSPNQPWDLLRSAPGQDVDVEQLLQANRPNAAATALYEQYAIVADGLQALEDAGVVVIFKPYHEGTASHHFWWSKVAQEVHYAQLWRELHDYMTIERGLSNLIWEWCPKARGSAPEWTADPESPDNPALLTYPGTDYVDIISMSWYAVYESDNSAPKYEIVTDSHYRAYKGLGAKPFDGKIFALGEAGPRRSSGTPNYDDRWDYRFLLSTIRQQYPEVAYWQSWGGRIAMTSINDHTVDVMHDPQVVTLDDVDWRPRTGDQIALRSDGSYLTTLGNRHLTTGAGSVTAAENLGVERHGDGTVSLQVASIGKFIGDYVLSDHRLRAQHSWNTGNQHRFDMVPAGHGRFSLRSNLNAQFVRSPAGEYSRANELDASLADQFEVRVLNGVGDGRAVVLHAAANDRFVQMDGTAQLRNDSMQPASGFIAIDLGNGTIALRSIDTGELACTDAGDDALRLDGTDPSIDRCRFGLTFGDDGLATLQSEANGEYVDAPGGAGGQLVASQATPQPTSDFALLAVDAVLDDRVSVLVDVQTGHYVTTTATGDELRADATGVGPLAHLVMERSSPGRVAFRSPHHDGYLWLSEWANYRVKADRGSNNDGQSRFDIVLVKDGQFALRSAYSGMYWAVSAGDGRIRADQADVADAARFMAVSVADSLLPLP